MTHQNIPAPGRRAILRLGLTGAAGLGLAACGAPSSSPSSEPSTMPRPSDSGPSQAASGRPRVLLAYFSRAGENYYNGGRRNLEVGNTEVVAGLIADAIDCTVYRINAADPYSDSYDATRDRNVQEQNADARPKITDPLPSIDEFDTVLLGSPIWNVRPPMIMSTFTESYEFTGKTVFPLVTYAVSGMGRAAEIYTESCRGATIGDGLAVRGEEATDSRETVREWLEKIELLA